MTIHLSFTIISIHHSCAKNVLFFVENIAFKKKAWQWFPYLRGSNTFHARNAVDGLKTDLSGWGGQCAISALNHRFAIWSVDLGDTYNIRHVKIYYRTDNVAFGLYFILIAY
jgi:hypothetical protein